ncbi:MAG: hypothetical protein ACRC63_02635, partial [Metamycoplasmataceae bacterium]
KSLINYIQIRDRVDAKTALKQYEALKKFNEAEGIETMLSIGGGANVEDMGDDEGGRPDKKQNTGEDNDKQR